MQVVKQYAATIFRRANLATNGHNACLRYINIALPGTLPVTETKAQAQSWLATAVRPDIVKRSLRVALLVGTILALINHGDRLWSGDIDAIALVKILFTYLVPFAVSTWASVQTARADRAAA